MSRITYYDDLDALAYGRWARNTRQTFASKRGQQALREIEAALLALPAPRLISGHFFDADPESETYGEACVLGAYAAYKGVSLDALDYGMNNLPEVTRWGVLRDEAGAQEEAEWAEANLGMAYTLAWNLMDQNDEIFKKLTPEQRYTEMLAFVRSKIVPVGEPA